MRILVFGPEPAPALAQALAGGGAALEYVSPPVAGAEADAASLAAALRDAGSRLEAKRPDVVLVCGSGEETLMGAVTAVKLGIPTAAVAAAEGAAIAPLVAHLQVSATQDAPAAAQAILALASPTLPRP